MKITVYELLGMVKDGKAPKKIKIDNKILNLENGKEIKYKFECGGTLNWDYYIELKQLNYKVEILEEGKKIPEKLGICAYEDGEIAYSWSKSEALLKTKINEIIDYINKGDSNE